MLPKVIRYALRILSWAFVIIFLLVVTLMVFGAMQLPIDRMIPAGSFDEKILLELLFVLIIWLIATLVHETGHFLAARAQGMTVSEVKIWWLVFTARRHGYRVKLRRSMGWTGGWIKATVGPGPVRRQMLMFILGGPLSNILCGCACAGLLWLSYASHSLIAGAIFASLALTNLFLGIGNLLPVGIRIPSDGSRLYHWLFEAHRDQAAINVLRLVGGSVRGLRSRDFPQELLKPLLDSPLASKRFVGGWFLMRGAMDRKDLEGALNIFDTYSDTYAALPKQERDSVDHTWKFFLLEHAYLQALLGGSAFDAHQELEAPGREVVPVHMRLRLEAAMHHAEGEPAKARACMEKALGEVEDSHDIGGRNEETDLLAELGARLSA